jgi:hypothetical protein
MTSVVWNVPIASMNEISDAKTEHYGQAEPTNARDMFVRLEITPTDSRKRQSTANPTKKQGKLSTHSFLLCFLQSLRYSEKR